MPMGDNGELGSRGRWLSHRRRVHDEGTFQRNYHSVGNSDPMHPDTRFFHVRPAVRTRSYGPGPLAPRDGQESEELRQGH